MARLTTVSRSVISGSTGSVKRSAKNYFTIGGPTPANATEGNAQIAMPFACTVSDLYVRITAAVGGSGSSQTFTVRKNGAATAITCTISGAAGQSGSDTANSVAFAAGDLFSIESNPSTGTLPTDNLVVYWAAEITA